MAQAGVLARPDVAAHAHPGPIADTTTESARHRGLLLGILVVGSIVTALGLRGHAMWFDEIQAWNIARASHSLPDLYANLRYEGHPVLWYLPLYVITRFTHDPHALQVLQWVIATATMALVLFRAPFSIPIRVAVLAGYCFAFEYGVVSRSYGLSTLLIVGALVLLARPQPRWATGAFVLVLVSFTSLPGAVLAIAVVVTVAWVRRAHYLFAGTVLAASAMSAWTCVPPSDFSNFAPGLQGSGSMFGAGTGVHMASAVAGTWRALVPIPAALGDWNSNFLDGVAGSVWVEAGLAAVLMVVVWCVVRPYPFARCLWVVGSIGYVAFFAAVILPEHARYAGFVLLLFIATVWLAHAPPGEERARPDGIRSLAVSRRLLAVVVLVLAAQIVATAAIWPSAIITPFSRDEALATAIRAAGLERAVVSGQDWDGTTVGGYLDQPVYSVVRSEWIRYFVHDDREARRFGKLSDDEILCAAQLVANRRQGPVAVLVDHPIAGARPFGASGGAALYRIAPGGRSRC
jgi:hypothetical protein